ncbi:hypothetical protein HDU80_005562 [Chytriomyces hyalinus]|nr:hypothetical protein HDU80_005562 [Chytriomyces hyalinus]
MDRLPVELLRSILMHAEIDAGLAQFAGACRKFTLVIDTAFALAHLRHRFQLPADGIMRFIKLKNEPRFSVSEKDRAWLSTQFKLLDNLAMHFRSRTSRFPFAYDLALFILVSQVDMLSLYPQSADTTLRIVQSSHSTTSNNAFNWDFALKFLVYTQHTAAIDYVIGNRLFVTSSDVLLDVLRRACSTGRTDIVSLLLTCPTSDTSPLDDALMVAVRCRQVRCVEAILNDPLQRVTCAGIDGAMWLSCCNGSYRIVTVLIQHGGVSVSALNSGLTAAVSSGSKELVSLLLQQPEVDPSLDNNACLKESVLRNSNDEIARLLLSDKRVSIATEGHAVVQTALSKKKTSHALLFLEVAEELKDADALWAMDAFLNEAGALDSRRTMFARITVHCMG